MKILASSRDYVFFARLEEGTYKRKSLEQVIAQTLDVRLYLTGFRYGPFLVLRRLLFINIIVRDSLPHSSRSV